MLLYTIIFNTKADNFDLVNTSEVVGYSYRGKNTLDTSREMYKTIVRDGFVFMGQTNINWGGYMIDLEYIPMDRNVPFLRTYETLKDKLLKQMRDERLEELLNENDESVQQD